MGKFKPLLNRDNWLSPDEEVHYRASVTCYTSKELCALFGVDYKTLRLFIAPIREAIGKRMGYYYTPKQVEMIFLHLGPPYDIRKRKM